MILAPRAGLRDALATLPRPRGALVRAPGPVGADEVIVLPPDATGFARELYGALRALEERGCVSIGVEDVPREPPWEAVLDRLRRACGAA
jgi:L-threonylcarbamoyladenylate synthase